MLGVCLLFVGIVLINNGACTLMKVDKKSASIMDMLLALLTLILNIISLVRGEYYAAATGFLFCFTYIFIVATDFFGADARPLGMFSTFVALNGIVCGIVEGITGCAPLGIVPDIRWAVLWWLWSLLWGTSFFTCVLGKDLGKFVPFLQVFEGLFTAWIPGLLMIFGAW